MKYTLTDETLNWKGHILHRIKDDTGKLGGWIESKNNLSQEGNCWVADEAKVYGMACVTWNAQILDKAEVYGCANIIDSAIIAGKAHVYDKACIYDNVKIYDKAKIYGCSEIYGNTTVSGNAKIRGYVENAPSRVPPAAGHARFGAGRPVFALRRPHRLRGRGAGGGAAHRGMGPPRRDRLRDREPAAGPAAGADPGAARGRLRLFRARRKKERRRLRHRAHLRALRG